MRRSTRQALSRADDDRLRALEGRAGLEEPLERRALDAEAHASRHEGANLGLGEEIARVDQAESQGLARAFVRARTGQRDEGIGLMAGGAADAVDALDPRCERPPRFRSLASPGSRVGEQLPSGVGQVERGAHRAADAHWLRPRVPESGAPGDGGEVPKDRIGKSDRKAARAVDEVHFEGGGLGGVLDVGGGEAGQARLAAEDAMGDVGRIDDPRAVGMGDLDGGDAEVAGSPRGYSSSEKSPPPLSNPLGRSPARRA